MKGQRLFVRETATEDESELRRFYLSESFEPPVALDRPGVIARLVGDLVAHLSWSIDGSQAVITHIYVATALRKKRVGLGLILDAIQIARRLGIEKLVVAATCPARGFFLRTGFAETNEALVREVS